VRRVTSRRRIRGRGHIPSLCRLAFSPARASRRVALPLRSRTHASNPPDDYAATPQGWIFRRAYLNAHWPSRPCGRVRHRIYVAPHTAARRSPFPGRRARRIYAVPCSFYGITPWRPRLFLTHSQLDFGQFCWVIGGAERYGLKQWITAAKSRLHPNVLAIALARIFAGDAVYGCSP
jgi:hypothetical protein